MNCHRNYPWYRDWHEDYADRVLQVIGIHTPETEREHDIDRLREDAAEKRLPFPILVDNDRANWNAWGNSMWPTVYLIDKQGRIRYWWFGELNWKDLGGEKRMRDRIEELLREPDRQPRQ